MNEFLRMISWINGTLWALEESCAHFVTERALRIYEHLACAEYKAMLGSKQEEERQKPYAMAGGVAVIEILGAIIPKADDWYLPGFETALDVLNRKVAAAERDPAVKAIGFYIDSPGGSVLGVDETSKLLYELSGRKPTGAFYEGLGASAAYYLGSAAGVQHTTSTSLTGSIGVISIHLDWSEYLQQRGIKPTVMTYGELKGAGNPYEKLSGKSKETIQKRIDTYGAMFEGSVARNRGISLETVKTQFGRGTVFVGAEAKQRGLVDAVGSFDEFLSAMSSAVSRKPASVGQAAKVAAVPSATSPAAELPQQRSKGMNPKILAALYARNLINSQECSEEVAQAALAGFFNGNVPKGDDAILKGLTHSQAHHFVGEVESPGVIAARERELAEAREASAVQERARCVEIRQRGSVLGISSELIEAGVSSGKKLGDLLVEWTKERATNEPPAFRDVRVTEQGKEQFASDVTAALMMRLGCSVEDRQRTPDARRLTRAPLVELARQSLQLHGIRIQDEYDKEAVIKQAFAMEGFGQQRIGADGGPVNRPGSFPNLLSNLANKVLDDAIERAEVSYPEWTGMWPDDLPDFKPAVAINRSRHAELDEMLDAEAFKEFGLAEEVLSHMQLGRYGNKFGLTPVMAANDDLGAFKEDLLGMGEAGELTTNRLCLNLLTGNVPLLDGVNLFDDSGHSNVITAGGAAPSVTTWDAMQQKVNAQRDVGSTAYIRGNLAVALLPPKHITPAQQTFFNFSQLAELKNPVTDATVNPVRGKVKVVPEPELQASSVDIWYGFLDPARRPTIVRAYFRGWGKAGKRERWYDPNTGVWWVSIETRVGAAAKNYRYAVRNPGQ